MAITVATMILPTLATGVHAAQKASASVKQHHHHVGTVHIAHIKKVTVVHKHPEMIGAAGAKAAGPSTKY